MGDMKSQDKSVNEALFESKNSHDNYQCVSYFDIAKYTASVRVQSTRRHFTTQTHRHTDKQTEIAKTEGPIDFFLVIFFLDFFLDERSNTTTPTPPPIL